jgi:hypothetical protein
MLRSEFHSQVRDLPLDLGGLIGKSTLIRMAFEAVDATEWPRPLPPLPDRTPEPVLRTLLAFCYCAGIFASAEIRELSSSDATVRYLCANDNPTFEELRCFRRQNVSHLRETLARMIHACWSELHPDEAEVRSFLPFLVDADRRLRRAIEADSAAMDD